MRALFSLEDEGVGAVFFVLAFFLGADIGIPLFSDRRVRSDKKEATLSPMWF